jgi:hypothetical protein
MEYTLGIDVRVDIVLIYFRIILNQMIEEGRRRQLPDVTDNGNLIPSKQSPQRILRPHLAGLIIDNYIESSRFGIEELSY